MEYKLCFSQNYTRFDNLVALLLQFYNIVRYTFSDIFCLQRQMSSRQIFSSFFPI